MVIMAMVTLWRPSTNVATNAAGGPNDGCGHYRGSGHATLWRPSGATLINGVTNAMGGPNDGCGHPMVALVYL